MSAAFVSHSATAAWATGGSVDKIEVYENEGGVTHFRGGFRPCVIPAGYVGVSFSGGVFVALSGSRVGATIAAGMFGFALLVCLRYVFVVVVVVVGLPRDVSDNYHELKI